MTGDPNLYINTGYLSDSTEQLPGPGFNNSVWSSELQVIVDFNEKYTKYCILHTSISTTVSAPMYVYILILPTLFGIGL